MTGRGLALRTALALAYPFLAHAANARDDGVLAAVALGDLALVLLVGPLLRWQGRAWGLLAAIVVALVALSFAPHATLPLLAPPVVFTALAGWVFARTLQPGRVPLITRMASALHATPVGALDPALGAYTRRLTGFWAALLFALCLVNLVLAVFATPEGLLARLGHASPLAVLDARGSLFANLLIHGVVAGCFLAEYAWRRHRFSDLPDRNLPDFLRRMAALPASFWRDLVQDPRMRFRIPHDHPALAGHFPGNPVVPGVVVLEHVIAAIEARRGTLPPLRLPQVKFLSPLRPGEYADIELDGDGTRLRFRVVRDGTLVATGEVAT